jgi:hypothetical protein
MTEYPSAHKDDLAALATVAKQARAARVSGQSVDQRRAFFAQTAPVRQRVMVANKELGVEIQNILTADQYAWLASHRPARMNRTGWRAKRNA